MAGMYFFTGGSCHRLISSTGLRSRQGSRPFILPTSRPTSRLLTHTPPTRSVSPNSDLGASSFANFTPQPELTSPLNELYVTPLPSPIYNCAISASRDPSPRNNHAPLRQGQQSRASAPWSRSRPAVQCML